MSGDVFGNGMLLSEHIRLVAAFDHRHVFLDPDPDPRASYAERRRLFDLPRSSWADYDTSLHLGGRRRPPADRQVDPDQPRRSQARLGLADGVGVVDAGRAACSAILAAPVDLLWNGGIGTYVKARTETHADVGDKANDAIRVDGADLRAQVVGEGGNLGLHPARPDRVRRWRGSAHINTDAIDNSAGVDTSDHEVNIKILLDQAVRDEATRRRSDRNALLAEMTDDVARLVLARQLRAERPARQRPGAGAGDALRARAG